MSQKKDQISYSICQCEALILIGQAVKLTEQKKTNIKLSQQLWQKFNMNLKKIGLTQGGNWVKYAVMERKNDGLFYYCAIPKKTEVPNDFIVKNIMPNTYLVVEHVGDMDKIYDTYTMIYHHLLPDLNFKPLANDFLHFEKYDYRFHWHKENSIIEIWVPIQMEEK